MDRTGRPEQAHAPALRRIIKMIDMAIENGSLDASDRDEVIKMFISGPTTVVDNKAGGGMMNMNEMIRPIGMAGGGDWREALSAMIAKLDSEIVSLRLDQMYIGDDNEKAIQSKQNQLDYFRDKMKTLEK
jgi:hypothetical protein